MTVTFTQTITNGNYDSWQDSSNSPSLTQNPLIISSGTRWALLYFTNVTIPKGSTVSSATLSLYVINTSNDDPNLDIYCNDVDNAAGPTTNASDISGRTLTSSKATWNATGIGAGFQTSPSFDAAVQKVVGNAGWASGNALAVVLDGLGATTFQFYGAEQGTGFQPSISITYTPPGPAMPVVTRQFRARIQ